MIAFKITNRSALDAAITPLGISLMAVRGFLASKLRSRYLLKAIAALRAVTMHKSTNKKSWSICF